MGITIRISGIIKESIVNGPGIRYVVFTQGCKHNCPGCHNPHTHSFDGGTLIDSETIIDELKSNPLLDGITISGGEPFEQANALIELSQRVKELKLNVMVYTGYTYEHIIKNTCNTSWDKFLNEIDIIVDGPFVQADKNPLLSFRGSSNQRIIDVNQTRLTGQIVLYGGLM